MNVRELTFKGEDTPQVYACGKCGLFHSPRIYAAPDEVRHQVARAAAEECCCPRKCACGVEIERYWTACADCRNTNRLRKARVIDGAAYHGPVWADGLPGTWREEGYFENAAELLEVARDYDHPAPAFCHPCTSTSLQLDVGQILESACDDMHEDAIDDVVDGEALSTFIAEWNSKQTSISYHADTSRVIVLDAERFAALIGEARK